MEMFAKTPVIWQANLRFTPGAGVLEKIGALESSIAVSDLVPGTRFPIFLFCEEAGGLGN
jgi:hypothetical protein